MKKAAGSKAMFNSFLSDKGAFRINDWWRSKAALLMGMVYLFTAWFDIGFEKFIPLSLLSIATISGFASFGYLLNDFFDREQDARAGKKNFIAGKSPFLVIILFIITLSFLLLPWKFLPFNKFSVALIIFQVILFLIYSVPPVRLKERGIAGIIADALYAHSVPVVLACYTFSLASEKTFPVMPIILLFGWQTMSGVRNILLHQSDDLTVDQKSGAKNYVAGIYPHPFFKTTRNLILLELLFSLIFIGMLIPDNRFLSICFGMTIFLAGIAFLLFGDKGVEQLLKSKWKYFPNNIYEKWIPPAVLIVLAIAEIRFVAILLLHLVLFNFEFFTEFKNRGIRPLGGAIYAAFFGIIKLLYTIKGVIHIVASSILNYSIYYGFLLFGIDLKKEHSSALDYLKRQRKTKQR